MNKNKLFDLINKSTFSSDEHVSAYNKKLADLIIEHNKTQPIDRKIYDDYISRTRLGSLETAMNQLPQWVMPKDSYINIRPERNYMGVSGYVSKDKPNVANITSINPTTIAHELAHVRQNRQDFPIGGYFMGRPYQTGAVGDSNIWEIHKRLMDIKKNNPDMLADNWGESKREIFANLESDAVIGLKKGIPLHETKLGKLLNLDTDSELKKYILERTLLGVPQVYEGQVPNDGFFKSAAKKLKSLLK